MAAKLGKEPISYDENGNPIYGYDKDGNPIIGYDENGNPIYGHDKDGNAIIGYDKDGRAIIGYDADGNPIYANMPDSVDVDENGNKFGIEDDKKIQPGFGADGKPLSGFGPDGRPLPGFGLDGKPLPGFDENGKLIDDMSTQPQPDPLADALAAGEESETDGPGLTPTGAPVSALGLNAEQQAERQQAVEAMSVAMAEQMGSILENKSQSVVQSIVLTDPAILENLFEEAEAEAEAEGADADEIIEEILLPAGEIVFAQTLIEANSDIEGPVLAQIVSGPLNGSKVLGTFTTVDDEYLTLNFDTLVLDGKSVPIAGIAVDPDTNLTGMATDVDNHYLERIVLPMAASFIEGTATAISEAGLTTVTIQGDTVTSEEEEGSNDQDVAAGISEAGAEFRTILDEMVPESPTVTIAPGTPIGILFSEPVTRTLN